MGVSYIKVGELDRALEVFATAARLKPENAVIRFNLARALLEKGLLGEAEKELREVLRLNPNNAKAAHYLNEINRVMKAR
jgi:predicted Zn-dependent protease